MFKIINRLITDKLIKHCGFSIITKKSSIIRYSKYITLYDYEHIIEICKKSNGSIKIHSYSAEDYCRDKLGLILGNCSVSLTPKEMILFGIKALELR